MPIRIYNTLTRKKDELKPVEPGKVKIYLCGPTVYMESHIGHAVGPVVFDTLKRYLEYRGYKVTLVINITDVDDKIIRRASEQNIPPDQLAESVTRDYMENIRRLAVDSVDYFPRVTDHIPDIVSFIERLMKKGYAYSVNGDVYFSVAKKADYGKLSRRSPDELLAGARVEVDPRKKDPMDFALWKSSKEGEPSWESPWGRGRPGWHIECSVMSTRYLGETFDIHGGGVDLVFPHHENEIAQAEAATGKPFASIWMHNGLMTIRREKMSKSLGNLVLIRDLFEKYSYSSEVIRLFLLSTHYRSPIDFSLEGLDETRRALDGFHRFFQRVERISGQSLEEASSLQGLPASVFANLLSSRRLEFLEAMDDDFNTARAMGVLFRLLSDANAYIDANRLEGSGGTGQASKEIAAAAGLIRELGSIFGLFRELPGGMGDLSGREIELVELLVKLRQEARDRKDFTQADRIRNELARIGVRLEDRPGGTTWRKV